MTSSYTAIINPISGGGVAKGAWRRVEERLRSMTSDVESVESRDPAHATALARDAAAEGRIAVSVGGDGHIRHVARGLIGIEGSVLGIVPAGRGNDLVRHLGIPDDPDQVVEVLTGDRRRIDVIETDDQIALGNVYVGLDSRAAEGINRARWMGPIAYRVVPVLTALRWRAPRFTVTLDGETVFDDPAHMVVVANSGDYGHGLRIVPSAEISDGRLDLLVVRGEVPVTQLSTLMKQAKTGAHLERDDVLVFRGAEVSVKADRQLPVHADGDGIGVLPFTAVVRAAALDVLA